MCEGGRSVFQKEKNVLSNISNQETRHFSILHLRRNQPELEFTLDKTFDSPFKITAFRLWHRTASVNVGVSATGPSGRATEYTARSLPALGERTQWAFLLPTSEIPFQTSVTVGKWQTFVVIKCHDQGSLGWRFQVISILAKILELHLFLPNCSFVDWSFSVV